MNRRKKTRTSKAGTRKPTLGNYIRDFEEKHDLPLEEIMMQICCFDDGFFGTRSRNIVREGTIRKFNRVYDSRGDIWYSLHLKGYHDFAGDTWEEFAQHYRVEFIVFEPYKGGIDREIQP